jgi:hypothetical protein
MLGAFSTWELVVCKGCLSGLVNPLQSSLQTFFVNSGSSPKCWMSGGKSESRYYVSTTHHKKPVSFFKKPSHFQKAD